MPKVSLYSTKGEVVGDIELKDEIFGLEVNDKLLHAVVVNQLANKRQGTQSTKTISEVRGGGAKPYRQKGTGRARQGSIRSAQWVGGAVALGPKPRSYSYTMPKKQKRLALKNALSAKVAGNEIIVVDEIKFDQIKTKQVVEVLNNLKVEGTTLIVMSEADQNVIKSAKNIPGVATACINTINVYDILKHQNFIITKGAVEKVEEVYA